MGNKAELGLIYDELRTLNEHLNTICNLLDSQVNQEKQIVSYLKEFHYLLQFNLGVNVNNQALINISEYLKEIKDKL